MEKRYRFNRKEGKVYLESSSKLIEVGTEIKVIILWASEVTFGKPFAHLPTQDWVQLTFLDRQMNWCYGLLNSGTTNALLPWIQYRREVEKRSHELYEIVTTISFESSESTENQWFDYSFSGIPGKCGIGSRMRSLISSSEYPLVDISLELPI